MSETVYPLDIPTQGTTQIAQGIMYGTVAAIETIKANCEQALARAEAEKPKALDVGIIQGAHVIYDGRKWLGHFGNPDRLLPMAHHLQEEARPRFNITEVLDQGPIVFGMPVGTALQLKAHFAICGGEWRTISEPLNAALARYEEREP